MCVSLINKRKIFFMISRKLYAIVLALGFAVTPFFGFAKKPETTRKIQTKQAPTPIGPYNQAIITTGARTLYISGQIPFEQNLGIMVNDIRAATTLVMMYCQGILKDAKMDFNNVVKTTILLADMDNFPVVNEVYGSYFTDSNKLPARETYQPLRLPKDAVIEISMIAVAE